MNYVEMLKNSKVISVVPTVLHAVQPAGLKDVGEYAPVLSAGNPELSSFHEVGHDLIEFVVMHGVTLTAATTDEREAKNEPSICLEVVVAARYETSVKGLELTTEDAETFAKAFAQQNAHLHTWPYLRCLFNELLVRLELPSMQLPLFLRDDVLGGGQVHEETRSRNPSAKKKAQPKKRAPKKKSA